MTPISLPPSTLVLTPLRSAPLSVCMTFCKSKLSTWMDPISGMDSPVLRSYAPASEDIISVRSSTPWVASLQFVLTVASFAFLGAVSITSGSGPYLSFSPYELREAWSPPSDSLRIGCGYPKPLILWFDGEVWISLRTWLSLGSIVILYSCPSFWK